MKDGGLVVYSDFLLHILRFLYFARALALLRPEELEVSLSNGTKKKQDYVFEGVKMNSCFSDP